MTKILIHTHMHALRRGNRMDVRLGITCEFRLAFSQRHVRLHNSCTKITHHQHAQYCCCRGQLPRMCYEDSTNLQHPSNLDHPPSFYHDAKNHCVRTLLANHPHGNTQGGGAYIHGGQAFFDGVVFSSCSSYLVCDL